MFSFSKEKSAGLLTGFGIGYSRLHLHALAGPHQGLDAVLGKLHD
jgi:hypothetical protein